MRARARDYSTGDRFTNASGRGAAAFGMLEAGSGRPARMDRRQRPPRSAGTLAGPTVRRRQTLKRGDATPLIPLASHENDIAAPLKVRLLRIQGDFFERLLF